MNWLPRSDFFPHKLKHFWQMLLLQFILHWSKNVQVAQYECPQLLLIIIALIPKTNKKKEPESYSIILDCTSLASQLCALFFFFLIEKCIKLLNEAGLLKYYYYQQQYLYWSLFQQKGESELQDFLAVSLTDLVLTSVNKRDPSLAMGRLVFSSRLSFQTTA